jgi:hypothetical protein
MGGTGLEPVTPSLSSPNAGSRAFATTTCFWLVCSTFLASPATALAHVCGRFRFLLLAPVSTVIRLRRQPCVDHAACNALPRATHDSGYTHNAIAGSLQGSAPHLSR